MDSFTAGPFLRGSNLPLRPLSTPASKSGHRPRTPPFVLPQPPKSMDSVVIRASHPNSNRNTPLTGLLRTTAGALILTATTTAALLSGKFAPPPARAEPPNLPPTAAEGTESGTESSALSQFLESNADAVEALRSLLYQKLEDGEDAEALKILNRLMAAQPSDTEWKFLAARLLNEMGKVAESRKLFEDILSGDPFSFEALFENAVLMDRCGEGDAAVERLERALEKAKDEGKDKEARDVRLIMAQIQFLQKKVEEALTSYAELAREDPKDYRPYFCQGVIYSLMDQNSEAREKFAKYKELMPRKFEVDGFLQTPLSRVKLFGTEGS